MLYRGSILAILLAGVSATALGGEKPEWRSWPTGERVSLGYSYYKPNLDTVASIRDVDFPLGAEISFERNLNLDSRKGTSLADFRWRISKRNSLRFNYFDLSRSSFESASGARLFVGDAEIDITLPIESFFDVTVYDVSYAFSPIMTAKHDLSVGLGISLQEYKFGIRGISFDIGGITIPLGQLVDERVEITAPLPTFKAGYRYAFNDKWMLDLNGGWLEVELQLDDSEDLTGRILTADAAIRWKAFKYASFRLGYQYFDVDIEYRKRALEGTVNYTYKGPLIGADVFF